MTVDELETTLKMLRKYGVREWGMSTAGPYVTFFESGEAQEAPRTMSSEEWQTTQHASLPAANLPVKIRDLLWSTPEYQEEASEP